MVERTSKFLLIVAVSVCFMLILYQYVGPGLSLGSPSGRSYSEELDLFPTPDPHYVKKYYFPVRELERELAFDMKGEDVIVFLHIQKTGGTTFGRHLVQNVRLEVPCDCRPGQKKCTCYRPNRRETWLFSRFSTGWSCGLHADWTELTNCVPGVLDRRENAAAKTPRYRPAAVSPFPAAPRAAHPAACPGPSTVEPPPPVRCSVLLTGEVFQPSDHFCGPPVDPLQQVHAFPVLGTPELTAGLQAQDTVGLLGCECALSAHVQLFIHQYPQVPLHRAALNPFIPQPVLILGVAPTQVQDLALGLVEPHEVHMGPLHQLVQVPLDGILSLRHVNCTTQLGVLCKLAEGALDPTVCVIDEDIKYSGNRFLRDKLVAW
ncbi:hypothetical protein QYF61_024873 [Mycteria americana]|uniref:Heparan-sulfate 6-O-sulfotransferase n=1 Tax=Mycteria americana TaxID=33587 RepID=A0AAN7N6M1_MYCAM|nr:hypothetical protein QYF61_024873 [Mycteria americana]